MGRRSVLRDAPGFKGRMRVVSHRLSFEIAAASQLPPGHRNSAGGSSPKPRRDLTCPVNYQIGWRLFRKWTKTALGTPLAA
ncbi:MAG: hypothetical protein ABI600_14325 [Luteolibacter sp.]